MKIVPHLKDFWYSLTGEKIIFLTYHSISTYSNPYAVSPETFRAQMAYIKKHGFNVISLPIAVNALKSGRIPRKSLVITFDDGYKDNYTNALPVLDEFNYKATFFIVTGNVGGKSIWDDWHFDCMGWNELTELKNHGHTIRAHTSTHSKLG